MSKLISSKEALIAMANGDEVLWRTKTDAEIKCFKKQTPNLGDVLSSESYMFWIKPRTITINGIEVPAPFEPKEDGMFYILDDGCSCGYRTYAYEVDADAANLFFGLWRTEEEIKQVVAALRQVFNVKG